MTTTVDLSVLTDDELFAESRAVINGTAADTSYIHLDAVRRESRRRSVLAGRTENSWDGIYARAFLEQYPDTDTTEESL